MAKKHPPTGQQQAILVAALDKAIRIMKIKAGAGGGKTTTLVMIAEATPEEAIYMCFNKATATEAESKFPDTVEPRTSHSLAFEKWGRKLNHKTSRPKGRGYVNVAGTGTEIGKYFNLGDLTLEEGVVLRQGFLGFLSRLTVQRFEQSADDKIELKHVPTADLKDKLNDDVAFIARAKEKVLWAAKMLWTERIDEDSPVLISPDTYLKLFQLSKPVLHRRDGTIPEILFVDEFQDTTPCVLDIVMRQADKMKIIVVGDDRQAIYGWRGAVNAMQMVDAPTYPLTKSFRYGQAIADVATTVLERDMVLTGNEKITSMHSGDNLVIQRSEPYTRLFRTNAALLSAAVEAIKKGRSLNIEIDVRDFVKFLESAQSLHVGDRKKVKHDKLLAFEDWEEAKAESDHDAELARVVKVIESGLVEDWIETLTNHVNVREPHIIFTTAHKAKGREFEQVIVENDFRSCYNEDGKWVGLPTEEQNLLYVALTRAIFRLQTNKTIREYLERGPENDDGPSDDMSNTTWADLKMSLLGEELRETI